MAENPTEVLVGGAVLAVAVGFLVYAGQTTGFVQPTSGYDLRASFRSVDGISVGTDVRLGGVRIGSVSDISLNPQTFFADATLRLTADVSLPDDTAALISSEGLLGGNFVELVPGGSPSNLEPGAEIEDTQGAVSLTTLLLRFVGGMGSESEEESGDAEVPGPVAE